MGGLGFAKTTLFTTSTPTNSPQSLHYPYYKVHYFSNAALKSSLIIFRIIIITGPTIPRGPRKVGCENPGHSLKFSHTSFDVNFHRITINYLHQILIPHFTREIVYYYNFFSSITIEPYCVVTAAKGEAVCIWVVSVSFS